MIQLLKRTLSRSLKRRFLLVNGVFLLASGLLLGSVFFFQARASMHKEFDKRGRALTGLLASETWLAFYQPVVTDDGESIEAARDGRLQSLVEGLAEEDDVAFASIQDPRLRVLSFAAGEDRDASLITAAIRIHGGPSTAPIVLPGRAQSLLRFATTICNEHRPSAALAPAAVVHDTCRPLAVVTVGLSPDRTMAGITGAFVTGLAIALGFALIGMILVTMMIRWTFKPIGEMAQVARSVAAGDRTARVRVDSEDEIGALAEAFNHMTWSLADSQEELGRRNTELQMVAAEKERLYKNAQIRATRLQVMNELAKAMASSRDADEIYGHVNRQLTRLMQFEYLTVQRYLPDEQMFRRDFVYLDEPVEGIEVGEKIKAEHSPVRRVQRTKMPLSMPDFDRDSMLADGTLSQAGFKSGFIVPIVAQDEFLGILGMACRRKNAFARMEVATVFAIADTLAVVLKNTELYQKLQAYVEELTETQHRLAKSENVRRAEKLRSVGQMASGIAHNFNNVMSAIIGRVQLLRMKIGRDEFVLDELEDGLLVIERAALDGAETVRRLQEFSRGQKADQFEKTDLNELVQSVIEITRPRWKDQPEQRGVHIEMRTKYSELPPVACVPSQLREALTNLIFNSVDAMPRGGRILIETEQDGSLAVIRFSDSGVGMPGDVRDRVFDPFFTTKGVKGSGLGLSTVYGIVERHAGEITVVSDPGQGATFILKLPLAKAGAKRARIEDMMASKPWRILVGDDEPNVREALADLLRLLGHDVETAHDGKSTVKLFQTGTFDMVFTDLGMPDMTGWEVTEAIREIDAEVPIVLATGWGSEIDEAAAQNRGVTRVLAKPFTVQKISSLVAELQGRRQAA